MKNFYIRLQLMNGSATYRPVIASTKAEAFEKAEAACSLPVSSMGVALVTDIEQKEEGIAVTTILTERQIQAFANFLGRLEAWAISEYATDRAELRLIKDGVEALEKSLHEAQKNQNA